MTKLWIRGKNPKNKGKLASIAVGVVSGTRDYTERPFSRPEIFSVKISFSFEVLAGCAGCSAISML
jgi:hypothetical protein